MAVGAAGFCDGWLGGFVTDWFVLEVVCDGSNFSWGVLWRVELSQTGFAKSSQLIVYQRWIFWAGFCDEGIGLINSQMVLWRMNMSHTGFVTDPYYYGSKFCADHEAKECQLWRPENSNLCFVTDDDPNLLKTHGSLKSKQSICAECLFRKNPTFWIETAEVASLVEMPRLWRIATPLSTKALCFIFFVWIFFFIKVKLYCSQGPTDLVTNGDCILHYLGGFQHLACSERWAFTTQGLWKLLCSQKLG